MSDGMTLEEAKRYFQNITAFADERDKKACEIAILSIAALEAEPSEDAISRQAVINEFEIMYKAAEKWKHDER